MKKIIILGSVILSGLAFSQKYADNPYVYEEETNPTAKADGDFPTGAGDPDPVPVDQYIPALFLAATALAFAYSKRKKIAE